MSNEGPFLFLHVELDGEVYILVKKVSRMRGTALELPRGGSELNLADSRKSLTQLRQGLGFNPEEALWGTHYLGAFNNCRRNDVDLIHFAAQEISAGMIDKSEMKIRPTALRSYAHPALSSGALIHLSGYQPREAMAAGLELFRVYLNMPRLHSFNSRRSVRA